MGWWEVWRCGQGSLASYLSRAICVEDVPPFSASIPESSCGLSLLYEWASKEIFVKKSPQCLNSRPINGCEKATERRARREFLSSEQSHKGCRKGMETLIEPFQCGFSAERVANEDTEKINRVVDPEALAREADLQRDLF
jgi:hypothetical protein